MTKACEIKGRLAECGAEDVECEKGIASARVQRAPMVVADLLLRLFPAAEASVVYDPRAARAGTTLVVRVREACGCQKAMAAAAAFPVPLGELIGDPPDDCRDESQGEDVDETEEE